MTQLTNEDDDRGMREKTTILSEKPSSCAAFRRKGRFGIPAIAVTGAFALGVAVGGGFSDDAAEVVAESSLTGRAEFATH